MSLRACKDLLQGTARTFKKTAPPRTLRSRTSSSRAVSVAVVLFAVLALACGSTLPVQQQELATVGDQDGLSEVLPPGAYVNKKGQVVSAEGEVLGSAEEFGVSARTGGTTTGAGTSTGSGTRSGAAAAATAPGVTETTITLGLPYAAGANEALTALGADAISVPDGRRIWEALIDDTNKRGGIAGRRVKAVYHVGSTTDDDFHRAYQEACANWTQDHHVFAALHTAPEAWGTEDFVACMERGGAAVVSGNTNQNTFDERAFPRYPHYVAPFLMDINTEATSLVDGIAKQKYFDKGAKLGLLTYDHPYYDYATKKSFIPALRRHGLKLSSIARVHLPQSLGEFSQLSNEAANAALKFKTEGVTHVMILDVSANIAFFFMQAAERQDYRPRYGLTSQSYGTTLADLLGQDANNQLQGARMIGWSPTMDVRPVDDSFSKHNDTYKRCMQLMRRNGVTLDGSYALTTALRMCDSMWITKAIVERGGKTITGDSYIAGIDRLGSSYVSGLNFASPRVSRQIRDGLRAVAPASYFKECRCFRYTAQPYSIPN